MLDSVGFSQRSHALSAGCAQVCAKCVSAAFVSVENELDKALVDFRLMNSSHALARFDITAKL